MNHHDPMFEPPGRTTVDEFLDTLSSRKVVGRNIRDSFKPVAAHSKSVAATSCSAVSHESNGPLVDTAAVTEKPIVSPLLVAPKYNAAKAAKVSRKTLNKLKRKRLEENQNFYSVRLSFSGRSIPCLAEPTTKEGRTIVNALRHGTLLAHELVSLDPNRKVPWPLQYNIRNQDAKKTDDDPTWSQWKPQCTYPDLQSIMDREQIFSLCSSSSSKNEATQSHITVESLVHLLMAMNAALVVSYYDRQHEDSYNFILVARETNRSTSMGLACIWSNFPNVRPEELITFKGRQRIVDEHGEVDMAEQVKMSSEKEAAACINDDFTEHNVSETSLSWNDLVLLYHSCVDQVDGALKPIDFVREKLVTAVVTLWNGSVSQDDVKIEKLEVLFDLLKQSKDGTDDVSILRTKSELADALKTRHPADKPSQNYVTLILLQILIRIQLLSMHNDDHDEREKFLEMYSSKCSSMPLYTSAPTKKRRKKSKKYTMDDYTMEICSIVEMLSFTLPSPSMFSQFLNDEVLKPCKETMPGVVSSIAEYFEFDISQELDATDESDQEESKKTQIKTDDAHVQKERLVSPWSNLTTTEVKTKRVHEQSISKGSKTLAPKVVKSSNTPSETRCNEKLPLESEEMMLFQNKVDLAVKMKTNNPLLADNKGRYVGRQFSNYFREIKVASKSVLTTNGNHIENDKKNTPEAMNHFVNNTNKITCAKRSFMQLRENSARKSSNISSSISTNITLDKESQTPKVQHPHAAVIKALAVMRKKR